MGGLSYRITAYILYLFLVLFHIIYRYSFPLLLRFLCFYLFATAGINEPKLGAKSNKLSSILLTVKRKSMG